MKIHNSGVNLTRHAGLFYINIAEDILHISDWGR